MRVKNTKLVADIWCGQTIASMGEYDLQPAEINTWRASDKVIVDLSSGDLAIGDGVTYKSTASEAVAFLLGTLPAAVEVNTQPAFASKKVGTKKLYTRATGKSFALVVGSNTLDFLIPYNEMKFTGIEIDGGKIGERVNLKILDTATGTISGVPNYMLNQFGFDVNLPDGFYSRESQYDADLIKDLVIRIELTAVEARNIGVNYLIHELKV